MAVSGAAVAIGARGARVNLPLRQTEGVLRCRESTPGGGEGGAGHPVRDRGRPPRPVVFVPAAQAPERQMSFLLRTASDPAAMIGAVRTAMADMDRLAEGVGGPPACRRTPVCRYTVALWCGVSRRQTDLAEKRRYLWA